MQVIFAALGTLRSLAPPFMTNFILLLYAEISLYHCCPLLHRHVPTFTPSNLINVEQFFHHELQPPFPPSPPTSECHFVDRGSRGDKIAKELGISDVGFDCVIEKWKAYIVMT